MKLQDILYENDSTKLAQQICNTLLRYLEYNARDEGLERDWKLAMQHYPQHVYHGPMYRGLKFSEQELPIVQAINSGDHAAMVKFIKDHGQVVNSFTTDINVAKDWVNKKSRVDQYGALIIEQSGPALKLLDLLNDLYFQINGRELVVDLDDDYGIDTELLASILPTCAVNEVFGFKAKHE